MNQEEGVTVVLTTHYMEEADHLCERVAIIDQGKIVALDTPENLKDLIGADIVTLEQAAATVAVANAAARSAATGLTVDLAQV